MNIKLKSKNIVAIFALLACLTTAGFAQTIPILGGYSPVSTKNAEVRQAAEFAVEKYGSQENVSVELKKILRAESQAVAGTNYSLCLAASISTEDEKAQTKQFLVVVYHDLQDEYFLTSWKEQKCSK